jgi:hypothetical protein
MVLGNFDPTWVTEDRRKLAELRGDLMQLQVELAATPSEGFAGEVSAHDAAQGIIEGLQEMLDKSESKEPPIDHITFARTMIESLSDEMRKEFFAGYCKECHETHGRCECELLEPDLPGEEA